MTWLPWLLAAVLAFMLLVLGKVLVNLATKEIEGRLDQLPFVILRVARWRLPAELREPMHDDLWLPDLCEAMRRDVERPLTRLIKGLCFSASLVVRAGRTARAADGVPSMWEPILRLICLAFPRSDPHRAEILAELRAVPPIERPVWVAEQLEVALFLGLGSRVAKFIRSIHRH